MGVESQVSILSHTPEPERLVASAARACWSRHPVQELYSALTDGEITRLLRKVVLRGHLSVLEHAQFTFQISGVSRVLTHQLVRHRIASYSQLSQQRVNQRTFGYAVPPSIRRDPTLLQKYESCMTAAREFYAHLLEMGIPKGSARYVLPTACETRIVVTMNARSLFNLLAQRECGAEDWEFFTVATRMHQELLKVAPRIFQFAGPRCKTERKCPEGEVGEVCGRHRAFGAAVGLRKGDLQRA